MLVFAAVRHGRKNLFGMAIILHLCVDIPAALYQKGVLSLYVTEGFIFIYVIAVVIFAYKVYISMKNPDDGAETAKNQSFAYAGKKYTDIGRDKKED